MSVVGFSKPSTCFCKELSWFSVCWVWLLSTVLLVFWFGLVNESICFCNLIFGVLGFGKNHSYYLYCHLFFSQFSILLLFPLKSFLINFLLFHQHHFPKKHPDFLVFWVFSTKKSSPVSNNLACKFLCWVNFSLTTTALPSFYSLGVNHS